MAFSTYCTNKGCGKVQEPYIDAGTNKVYCSICDAEINNITQFTKTQMKASKQFRQKKPKPFSVKCEKCGRDETPKLNNNNVVCGSCGDSLNHLSPIFKNMLKDKLKTVNDDVK